MLLAREGGGQGRHRPLAPEQPPQAQLAGPQSQAAQYHARQQHIAHGPAGRGQGHKQGEKEGHQICIIVAQHGAGQKARRKGGEHAGRHARFQTAQGPDPGKDDNRHQTGQHRRNQKPTAAG